MVGAFMVASCVPSIESAMLVSAVPEAGVADALTATAPLTVPPLAGWVTLTSGPSRTVTDLVAVAVAVAPLVPTTVAESPCALPLASAVASQVNASGEVGLVATCVPSIESVMLAMVSPCAAAAATEIGTVPLTTPLAGAVKEMVGGLFTVTVIGAGGRGGSVGVSDGGGDAVEAVGDRGGVPRSGVRARRARSNHGGVGGDRDVRDGGSNPGGGGRGSARPSRSPSRCWPARSSRSSAVRRWSPCRRSASCRRQNPPRRGSPCAASPRSAPRCSTNR